MSDDKQEFSVNSDDTRPGPRLMAIGGGKKATEGKSDSDVKFTVPEGSVWALLVVRPDARLFFSIETAGGDEPQLRTLVEGTLLANMEVTHRYLDNGYRSVNDVIPPQWRAKVVRDDGSSGPEKT